MSTYSDQIIYLGPTAYWRLSEANFADPAVDASGNGRTGTYTDACTPGVSKGLVANDSGNSCSFTNGHVSFVDISMTSEYTLVLSLKANSFTEQYTYIFSDDSGSYGLLIKNNHIFLNLPGHEFTNGEIVLGQTHHIVITKPSGSSLYTAYLDGVSLGDSSPDTAVGPYTFSQIGSAGGANNYGPFDGDIDHVALYDRIIPEFQVVELYEIATAPESAYSALAKSLSPTFYWKLDELNTSVYVQDASDNSVGGWYSADEEVRQPPLIVNDPGSYSARFPAAQDGTKITFTDPIAYASGIGRSFVFSVKFESISANKQGMICKDGTIGIFVSATTVSFLGMGGDIALLTNFVSGQIYHLVFTTSAGDPVTNKVYVDGVLQGSNSIAAAIFEPTVVGGSFNSLDPFIGFMDEILSYRHELTQQNATDLYLESIKKEPSEYTALVTSLSPVSYWKLGDSHTTVAKDEIGGYPGAYVNGALNGYRGLIENDIDTAAFFPDQGAISFPAITFSGARSFVASVKFNDLSAYNAVIAEDMDSAILVKEQWVSFQGIGGFINMSPFLQENVIYQMVFTTSASAINSVYVDGVLIDTDNDPAASNDFSPVFLGSRDPAVGNSKFDGFLDEVSTYDRELTQQEVTDLYNESIKPWPTPTNYPELVMSHRPSAYWRFEETSYTEACKDEIGKQNGQYAWDGDMSFGEPGLVVGGPASTCVHFNPNDGNDAYVDIRGVDGLITDMYRQEMSISFLLSLDFNDRGEPILCGEDTNGLYIWDGHFYLDGFGDNVYSDSEPLLVNVPYHLTITKALGTGVGCKVYIDGKYFGLGAASFIGSLNSSYIGLDSNSYMLAGKLDELTVYNIELTPAQIYGLSNVSKGNEVGSGTAGGRIARVQVNPTVTKFPIEYYTFAYRLHPEAYWRLGEANFGDTAKDETGYHHGYYDGLVTPGSPSLLVGDANTCPQFVFDGGQYIGGSVKYSTIDLPAGTPVTYMFVVKLTTVGTYQTVIGQFWDAGNIYIHNGRIRLNNMGGEVSMTPLTTDVVYHIAITKSHGTTNYKVYVDGVYVASSPDVHNGYFQPKYIGADSVENWDGMNGFLDEVAIYKRELSPAAIQYASDLSKNMLPTPADAFARLPSVLVIAGTGTGYGYQEVNVSGSIAEVSVAPTTAEFFTNHTTAVGLVPSVAVSNISGESTSSVNPSVTVADTVVSILSSQTSGIANTSGSIVETSISVISVLGSGDGSTSGSIKDTVVSILSALTDSSVNIGGSIPDVTVAAPVGVGSETTDEIYRDEIEFVMIVGGVAG